MDKYDWENSLDLLQNLLKTKKDQLEKQKNDIEEIEYSIKCYKAKIDELPTPKRKKPEKFVPPKIPTGVG